MLVSWMDIFLRIFFHQDLNQNVNIFFNFLFVFTGKHTNNNSTSANNNGGVNPIPITKPKHERRRTVSFRKGIDPREELLRRSTTPDVKEVRHVN